MCSSYLEEFTNLAGNLNRLSEKKPESESAEPGSAEPRNECETLTSEEIALNPWNLPQEDLEKLEHACKFMRKYASVACLKPFTKAFNKVLEIAATSAEEATAQSPVRAASPIRDPSASARNINREMSQEEATQAVQRALELLQETPASVQQLIQQNSTFEKAQSTDMPIAGKGLPNSSVPEESDLSTSEILEAARKFGNSSNASSCSCLSNHSDKAEGWTVIDDPRGETLKGKSNNT